MEITNPGAHVDQLLWQTRWHHVQLSSMADVKSNMLLTMASVIITLSIRYVTDPHLRWAAIVLMVFCLITIVLAAYAVMPKVSARSTSASKPDMASPNFNILFFGNFGMLDYEEYVQAMEDVMNDPSKVYEAQVREVYTLGIYLARNKYRFIRGAYIAFIAGLLASAIVLVATNTLMLFG